MKKLSWSGFKSDFFRRDGSSSRNKASPTISPPSSTNTPTIASSCMSLNQWNSKLACINSTRSVGDFRTESTLNLRERPSFAGLLGFRFSRKRDCVPDRAETAKPSKPSIFNSLKRKFKGNLKSPVDYSRFRTFSKRQSCCQSTSSSDPSVVREWKIASSTSREQVSPVQPPVREDYPQYSSADNMPEENDDNPLGATAEVAEDLQQPTIVANQHLASQSSLGNGNLAWELFKLEKFGWYWGRMTRGEAERKLADQPDGAFLVRDSSDDCHLLSLSFRCYGRTLHTRIEHSNGSFSFYAYPEADQHSSVSALIEYLMNSSRSGVFCYSRSRSPGSVSYPVQLTKPVSRFSEVLPLQFMCRFVIRQYVRMDHIEALPLPESLKLFIVRGSS